MKRLRFLSGVGNGSAIVPNGQILAVTMVPGEDLGSYVRINQSGPIFVPPGVTLDLQAEDLGNCCGDGECDRWPGEVQIEIVFGQHADPRWPWDPETIPPSDAPASWLVVYNGC